MAKTRKYKNRHIRQYCIIKRNSDTKFVFSTTLNLNWHWEWVRLGKPSSHSKKSVVRAFDFIFLNRRFLLFAYSSCKSALVQLQNCPIFNIFVDSRSPLPILFIKKNLVSKSI